MGQANIVVGIIVVISSVFLGVKIGIGTILNTIFIGLFIDLITMMNIISLVDKKFLALEYIFLHCSAPANQCDYTNMCLSWCLSHFDSEHEKCS